MKEDYTYRDQELFKRISQSDAQAFTDFFKIYSVKLAIYVSRFLSSDVWGEEIVQDVFLKLWMIRETLSEIENPAGFVYRMTANRAKDHLKHQEHEVKLQHYLSLYLQGYAINDTQEQFDYRTLERLFKEAIQNLPAKRARIFKMRHELGLGYEEIARRLKLSKHTVRAQLNLTIHNIRAYLLEHGEISGILLTVIYFQIIFYPF